MLGAIIILIQQVVLQYINPIINHIKMTGLPELVLYYVGMTSAVKVGRPFLWLCRKIKLNLYILKKISEC